MIQLQREIQEGLITLLIRSALPDSRNLPFTVITTSPSQWLPYCSSDNVTILDVSELVGSTEWHLKADAKDRLIEKIRASGWSEQQILSDTQLSAITSRVNSAAAGKIRDRIDIGLVGDNQQPIAVVGLYLNDLPLDKLSKETQFAAGILDIPFAISMNGEQLLLVDRLSEEVQELATFPSPQKFGLNDMAASDQSELIGNGGPTIIRCDTSNSLIEALVQSREVTVIIDYTLPWGDWKTEKASHIRALLPEHLQKIRQLDSYATLLLLVATQRYANRLVGVVPQIFTNAFTFAQVRNHLASIMNLTGLVELPNDLFLPFSRISSSILVLDTFKDNFSPKTAFLSLSSRGDVIQVEDQNWFSSLMTGLQGQTMKLGFHAEVKNSETWTVIKHHPKNRVIEERVKSIADAKSLGELYDIFIGLPIPHKGRGSGKNTPIIRAKDLASQILSIKDLTQIKIDPDISKQTQVLQGDILLQRIGTPQTVRVLVVDAVLEGAVALQSVIILRPKEAIKFNSALIKQFLQSMAGRTLLSMQTSSAITISTNALRTVPVPILPPEISIDLDELQKVENDLRLRADKIESMRLGLFNAESADEFRSQLRALRQTSQAITASIQQAESTDFQIRNFYPYPLVYPYRVLVSLIHPQDQYKEQLRIAENILAFLGSLTLALIPAEKYEDSGLDLKGYWQAGISPGHWQEICRKGGSVLQYDEANSLSIALSSLQKDKRHKQFREDIDKLIRMKNDFKHDRGPKIEEDFQEAISQASDRLRNVMYKLSFLTEYPIHLVRDVDLIRGTRRVFVKTLRYIGDHPGLPIEQREYPEALKKGDLYIQLQADRWVPLFPFMTVHNCPSCKTHETYFVDYWKDQELKLKSFERGHTQDDNEVTHELNSYYQ